MHGSTEPTTPEGSEPAETSKNEEVSQYSRNNGTNLQALREAVERAHRESEGMMSEMSPLKGPESDWTYRYSRRPPTRNPIRLAKEICLSVWEGKSLAYRLFIRNLAGRYRQTFLGLIWVIIPTLAIIGTWWFLAQQQVLNTNFGDGTSFIVFIAIGSVLWQTFFDSIQAPLRAVMGNQGIILKINFPRESLILIALGEVLFDMSIRLLLVMGFAAVMGVTWSPLTFLAPVLLIALILLGTGIGLFLTPVGILYQDIGRALTVLSPFWMILTPVVYPKPDNELYHIWNLLNPPATLLTSTRDLLINGTMSDVVPLLAWCAVVIPFLLVAMIWYRLSFPIFIERIAN